MGVLNYLVEGGSGTGKTAVCDELRRRGYHAIHGDRDLAYQGDPGTGAPTDGVSMSPRARYEQHLWDVGKVEALIANQDEAVMFFCGGSRNFDSFIELFDGVFILKVDLETLNRRIDARLLADPSDWGGGPGERELITQLHEAREGVPENGVAIDATAPLVTVVDEILRHVRSQPPA